MKIRPLSTLIACLAATCAVALFAGAEEQRHIKLVLQTDPEAGLVTIETPGDLALGETRSFTSEKGRPVLLTRTENGFEIDVDGRKTQVDLPEVGGEGFAFETIDEEGAAGAEGGKHVERRVIVKRMGGDAKVKVLGADGAAIEIHGHEPGAAGHSGKEVKIIRLGHGEGKEGKGEAKKIHLMLEGEADLAAARAKLIASGALDGLDEAARQKILAALGG